MIKLSVLLAIEPLQAENGQKNKQDGNCRQHAQPDQRIEIEHRFMKYLRRPVVESALVAEHGDPPGARRNVTQPRGAPLKRKQAVAEYDLHDDDEQDGQNGAFRFFQQRGNEQSYRHDADVRERHGGICADISRSGYGKRKIDKEQRPAEEHGALHNADHGEHGEFRKDVRRDVEPPEHLPREDLPLLADLAVTVENAHERTHDDEHEQRHVRARERIGRAQLKGIFLADQIDDDQHDGRLQNKGQKRTEAGKDLPEIPPHQHAVMHEVHARGMPSELFHASSSPRCAVNGFGRSLGGFSQGASLSGSCSGGRQQPLPYSSTSCAYSSL